MENENNPKKEAQLSIEITNLPSNITINQISIFCKKVGLLAVHPETGEDLILYNPNKNKAIVTYSYPEGVNHAIKLLSGECFIENHKVKVERALKEPYDFSKWKESMRFTRKYHSYLGGEEEISNIEQKRLKILILKKVFKPKDLIKDPELYGKIIKDFTEICSKYGKVTLVKPMETNPEGIVIIRFLEAKSASIAIGELDNAIYENKTILAEPWDGKDLSYKESEQEEQERINNFHNFQIKSNI